MGKEEAIEMERNWADFLPELFTLILKKLPDMCDFVRSRAVCKHWRSSSSISDIPPQFPWILCLSPGPNFEFYSIALDKLYTICAPTSSGNKLFKTVGGYMFTGKIGNVDSFSLLNPLSKFEVSLPTLHDCDRYLFPIKFSLYRPLSFQTDNYMFACEYGISVRCKLGDNKWDIIGPGYEGRYCCYYLKGLLFRIENRTLVTKVTDISSYKELYVIPPPKYEKISEMSFAGSYLVESCGEILSICYNQSYKTTYYKFYIHRLEFGNRKENPYWVKLGSIGDQILFFDFPLGTLRAFCLRASDFVGFNRNCIYFINKYPSSGSGHVRLINMYNIENGETIFIDTPFNWKNQITWFIPTLNHI